MSNIPPMAQRRGLANYAKPVRTLNTVPESERFLENGLENPEYQRGVSVRNLGGRSDFDTPQRPQLGGISSSEVWKGFFGANSDAQTKADPLGVINPGPVARGDVFDPAKAQAAQVAANKQMAVQRLENMHQQNGWTLPNVETQLEKGQTSATTITPYGTITASAPPPTSPAFAKGYADQMARLGTPSPTAGLDASVPDINPPEFPTTGMSDPLPSPNPAPVQTDIAKTALTGQTVN